ncbi:hypothetical protein GEMRC1_008667 [Eukaryota sp. GEM-RC1]
MLEMNTSLLVLNLDGLLYTSSSFPIVLNALENNSSLMKVRFSSLDLGCVLQIVDILASDKESRLTYLIDFSPNYVDLDRGVFQFSHFEYKNVCHNTSRAIRRNCRFTDESVNLLSMVLRLNLIKSSLIDISTCQLTSDQTIDLILALLTNSYVKNPTLKSNKIDDESAIVLAELLTDNSTIAGIDLSYNSITGKGALALFGAIQSNHRVAIGL